MRRVDQGSVSWQSSSLGHRRPGVPSDPLCRPWVNLVLKTCNPVPGSRFRVNSGPFWVPHPYPCLLSLPMWTGTLGQTWAEDSGPTPGQGQASV